MLTFTKHHLAASENKTKQVSPSSKQVLRPVPQHNSTKIKLGHRATVGIIAEATKNKRENESGWGKDQTPVNFRQHCRNDLTFTAYKNGKS